MISCEAESADVSTKTALQIPLETLHIVSTDQNIGQHVTGCTTPARMSLMFSLCTRRNYCLVLKTLNQW